MDSSVIYISDSDPDRFEKISELAARVISENGYNHPDRQELARHLLRQAKRIGELRSALNQAMEWLDDLGLTMPELATLEKVRDG